MGKKRSENIIKAIKETGQMYQITLFAYMFDELVKEGIITKGQRREISGYIQKNLEDAGKYNNKSN